MSGVQAGSEQAREDAGGSTSAGYRASLDYLYGRLDYERVGMPRSAGELGLSRMRRLLRALGDPQDGLRIVHVAGTKGKGSTSALIASAASAAGIRTGLFSSPHLHALEERYRIDGEPIEAAGLVWLADAVRGAVARLDAEAARTDGRAPTFFEITTAMGLLHFARRGCGLVVLETGMGGRLDSTNTVRPAVSVLTTISFDHTRQLGNTLGAIAGEKAGIIKRGRPVVSGVRGDEARAVIRRVAGVRRSVLHEIDTDFGYDEVEPSGPIVVPTAGRVRVSTWKRDWPWLRLPLLGPHQAHNAATALAALDALADQGSIEIGPESVERGWASLRFPARCEVVGERPWLVIDGAHNVESAQALAATLRVNLPAGPRTLVFGTTREKDLDGQLRALLPLATRCVATCYRENPRAVAPEVVAEAMGRLAPGCAVTVAMGPAEALEAARAVTPREGLIVVTGSLFLAAEARALVLGLTSEPSRTVATRDEGILRVSRH
jgi:dihydrofolate synthase/folylpolyglutamate synthase